MKIGLGFRFGFGARGEGEGLFEGIQAVAVACVVAIVVVG